MSIPDSDDPIALFAAWYGEAQSCGLKNPTAVTLATVDDEGRPSARVVLLKGFDAAGFVFYTNFESRKGVQLQATRRAALCFYWAPLDRQVRVEGEAEPVSDADADAYFATRARQSQIGAWASRQSRPLGGRFELEKRVAKFAMKYGVGTVPRPPWWSGFRVAPARIEFWREGAFRLHHRYVFERTPAGWTTERLYP
jgi:pyridoxamine 5'-phosphate oxidase